MHRTTAGHRKGLSSQPIMPSRPEPGANQTTPGGPLTGLRVLELGTPGPAPMACMVLAGLGADVIRVDRPGPGRRFIGQAVLGRDRRQLHLDLKEPSGVRTVLDLATHADILVEGFRPGVIERLGLGPEVLLEANPGLIIGRLTGWGQDGPWASLAAHDLNFMAVSGALNAGVPAGELPSFPLAAMLTLGGGSMFLVAGILAALVQRGATGRGQVIDASIAEGMTMLLASTHGLLDAENPPPLTPSPAGAYPPFYGLYRCADGLYLAVAAYEASCWRAFTEVLGLGDTGSPSPGEWPALRERIATILGSASRPEWLARFDGVDATVTPVVSVSETPGLPQPRARGWFEQHGGVLQPVALPRLDGDNEPIGDGWNGLIPAETPTQPAGVTAG